MPTKPRDARETAPLERSALTIVLPIFNEEANIGPLFRRIDESLREATPLYRIIAVDDGSTDGTAAVIEASAARLPMHVIRHPVNQGLGIAIRSGLMEALRISSADDVIFTMDADESHTPALMLEMLKVIDRGYDVVIASRFQPGSRTIGVPLHRRFLSVAAFLLLKAVFPTRGVRDFTCGYRAYRASALARASRQFGEKLFEFEGFQCMVDILLKLRASGARFAEVPAVLRYDLKQGASKMRIFRTAFRTLRLAALRRFGG